jgi:hypothetical protein
LIDLRALRSSLAYLAHIAWGPRPREYESSKAFYDDVDAAIARLRRAGFEAEAASLHRLLNEMAWTTGNELMGELRACMAGTLRTARGLPHALATELRSLIRSIDRAQRWR